MFTKLVRIGRDAELRYTNNQKAVISLACVYDVGFGDNKKSQWIDVSVWGKQAEALAQYLIKGKQIVIYADDLEIETYQKNDGTSGSKLKARVINIDLTSGGQQQAQQGYQQQAPQHRSTQQQGYQQVPKIGPREPDFDDDIPFAPIGLSYNNSLIYSL